jgi:hypothetical protein
MSTQNEIKKKIATDWVNAFPDLSIFAQNKLYKTIGPIVSGIELINLPRSDDYRPHFVIYSLWQRTLSECLESPIVLIEFKNNKGLQFRIPYSNQDSYFEEARECVKKQLPISFQKNLSISELLSFLYEYSKKHNSLHYLWDAELRKFVLYASLYTANKEIMDVVYNDIKVTKWHLEHFETCGVNYNSWMQEIENTLSNRDQFMAQIAANKEDKKMKKLQHSELLP